LTDFIGPTSEGRPLLKNLVAVPTYRDHPATQPHDIEGLGPDGELIHRVVLGTGGFSLLLFLSSSCNGCIPLWEAAASPERFSLMDGEPLIVVTKGPSSEPVDTIRVLSPPQALTVMSDRAFRDYRVHGPPFFVLVDGASQLIPTEGVAWGPEHVADHVARARRGEGNPDVPRLGEPGDPARGTERQVGTE